jgi:putative phosphoesterase
MVFMKIGIISDTHCLSSSRCEIPQWIREAFADTDMIVHAGDVEHPDFLRELTGIAPVYAVRGNCDQHGFNTPEFMSITTEAGLVTVAHRAETARRAVTSASRVMIYGHTHIALINQEEHLLVINPGSPTLPRGGLPASVAVLYISADIVKAELKQKP